VIRTASVETVTLGDATLADLSSLPESLATSIGNVLRRNAEDGTWRLDADPTEDDEVAAAIDDAQVVVTRGHQYHLDGVYAEFVYDSDADEIYAIAVFPGDASERDAGPDPHVLHREELPEDDRSAVDTSIDQDTYAELGDGREYV